MGVYEIWQQFSYGWRFVKKSRTKRPESSVEAIKVRSTRLEPWPLYSPKPTKWVLFFFDVSLITWLTIHWVESKSIKGLTALSHKIPLSHTCRYSGVSISYPFNKGLFPILLSESCSFMLPSLSWYLNLSELFLNNLYPSLKIYPLKYLWDYTFILKVWMEMNYMLIVIISRYRD